MMDTRCTCEHCETCCPTHGDQVDVYGESTCAHCGLEFLRDDETPGMWLERVRAARTETLRSECDGA